MKTKTSYLVLVFTGMLSLVMHYEPFSKELVGTHNWRQAYTQSNIINFYEEDMNIFNPRRNDRGDSDGIYRMEFPLMQWLVACAYKVFGNHLWIMRVMMFITGLLSVLGIYVLLKALFQNEILAVMGAWAFNFSPSFYYYTVNPMPDNLALCCSIWGIALFFIWLRKERIFVSLLCGLFLSLGALCKLPFILYFSVPFIYFFILYHRKKLNRKNIIQLTAILSFFMLPAAWYVAVVPGWKGNTIVKGMLDNQLPFSTILEFLNHNLIITLPELLLNYGSLIFFLAGFYFLFKNRAYQKSTFVLLLTLSLFILAYYFFEVNTIQRGHDYYLFPFLPLLFILVAYGAWNLYVLVPFTKYLTIALLLLLPLTAYLRIQGRWNYKNIKGLKKDLLLYKNELRNAVPKKSLVIAGNDDSHCIFFYYIDKKGWGFDYDYLPVEKLRLMIEKGAEYLYSSSRAVDGNDEIKPFLDSLLIEKGTIKVFSLKKSDLKNQD